MRKLCGLVIVLALSATALSGASSASAATEVGSNCAGTNTLASNFTAFQFSKAPGNPMPVAAPAAGIVTKWRVNSKVAAELPQQLKILRPTGDPKTFTAVAESGVGTVVIGSNVFDTRIPVQAGDRFAVFAGPTSIVLYCPSPNAGDEMGYRPENQAVGTANSYEQAPNIQIAISAIVEPDADSDGFGDESQDKCPRSAALQSVECPPISLSSFGFAKKGSALILASASSASQVTVSATATVGKKGGKKGKRAQASARVTIPAGTKPVGDGQIVPFALTFPPSLRSQLAATPPKKSLTLTVTTSTIDAAGQTSSTQLKLKLKGQKRG